MEALPAPQPAAPVLPTLADFLAFSENHLPTWKKAFKSNHPVWFHRCCFTFSTQKQRSNLHHPPEQGISLQRFLKQHDVEDEQQLAELLARLSAARPGLQAGQLPTVNEAHQEPAALDKRQDPGEVEDLLQQLADQQATLEDLEQQNQTLQKQNQALQQQLRLERTAAVQHENFLISREYVLYDVQRRDQAHGIHHPWHEIGTRGLQAARLFQARHSTLPVFGNIPRPNHSNPPAPALPTGPNFEDLLHQFLQAVLAGQIKLPPI